MLRPVADIPARRRPVVFGILESTLVMRSLGRAAKLCGGLPPLAQSLQVSLADLTDWVNGVAPPPLPVYIRVLEMVARSHLTRP